MNFAPLIDHFADLKLLVVGDVMLDEYVFGRATRISPEAPVMVVRHDRTTRVPGGAANVARNLQALGAEAHLHGVVGDDEAATLLEAALAEAGLGVALHRDADRMTTRKTRVLADARHQLVRIDHEEERPLSRASEEALIEGILAELENCNGVILSDYLKGSLTRNVTQAVFHGCKTRWKPVIVNPKPASLGQYRSATVISLNRAEASQAWGQAVTVDNATEAAQSLREQHRAEAIVVTLGDQGMVVAGPETWQIEAPKVEVSDPAGAGDTVIASVALGISAIGFQREVFEFAAAAASRVVCHVGVATPTAEDLVALRG